MSGHFIDRMMLVYGEPDSDDPKAFMGEYARMLKGYSESVLNDALDRLLRTRKFKTWPTIAECVGAAEDVTAARAAANRKPDRPTDFTREAEDVLKSDLGAKAAHEGWVLGLYDHVQRYGRKPTHQEVHELMDSAKYVDKCAAGVVDMGVAHAALLKLSRNILIRREELARRALNQPPLTDDEKANMRAA